MSQPKCMVPGCDKDAFYPSYSKQYTSTYPFGESVCYWDGMVWLCEDHMDSNKAHQEAIKSELAKKKEAEQLNGWVN